MTNIKKWGNATWFFLHTLAEKVKNDKFSIIKKDLFWLFKSICSSLPCPDCRNHADQLIKTINFKNITTKEDFKTVLFVFHNKVNTKLKKPNMEKDDFLKKYETANLIKISKYFLHMFSKSTRNFKEMINNNARKQLCNYIHNWLNKNLNNFDV